MKKLIAFVAALALSGCASGSQFGNGKLELDTEVTGRVAGEIVTGLLIGQAATDKPLIRSPGAAAKASLICNILADSGNSDSLLALLAVNGACDVAIAATDDLIN